VRPVVLLLFLVPGFRADALEAQAGEPLVFEVVPETGEAVLEIRDLFPSSPLLEAVHSGLPLRMQILVQLWEDGFFDHQRGEFEWRATIVYDPLTHRYRIQSSGSTGAEIEVNDLQAARDFLQQTLDIPLRPSGPGRYYYIAGVEMETLSLSDLEELQRWLQGELGPVVAGERDVEGALARGFRRVLVRMLGLPARRFQVRSRSFRIEEPERSDLSPPHAAGEFFYPFPPDGHAEPGLAGNGDPAAPHDELRLDHILLPIATAL
jgi:hypothetical protein